MKHNNNSIKILSIAAALALCLTGCAQKDDGSSVSSKTSGASGSSSMTSSNSGSSSTGGSSNTSESAPDSSAEESSAPDSTPSVDVPPEPSQPDTPPATTTSTQTSGDTPVTPPANKFNAEYFTDDLFIGDSIFTGLYLYNMLDERNVAAKVGYTPTGAYSVAYNDYGVTALERAAAMQPKRIFILLGSNGLAASGSNETLKSSYETLVKSLKEKCPDTKICCISLTPTARVTDYPNVKNEMVRDMNAYIKQCCAENGCTYFDFYSLVSDSDGYFKNEWSAPDGLHFEPSTYYYLLNELEKLAL